MCSQADDPTQHVTAHLDLRSIREPCAACGLPKHLDFCGGGEYCSLDDCLCGCHVTQHGDTLRAALVGLAFERKSTGELCWCGQTGSEQHFPECLAARRALAASATDEGQPPERFDRSWWHYADDCPASPVRPAVPEARPGGYARGPFGTQEARPAVPEALDVEHPQWHESDCATCTALDPLLVALNDIEHVDAAERDLIVRLAGGAIDAARPAVPEALDVDDLRGRFRGISLPPGPDFAWVDGHKPFIEAALNVIDEWSGKPT